MKKNKILLTILTILFGGIGFIYGYTESQRLTRFWIYAPDIEVLLTDLCSGVMYLIIGVLAGCGLWSCCYELSCDSKQEK